MQDQKGNVIIVILLFFVLVSIAVLVSFKVNHPAKPTARQSKVIAMDEKIQNYLASQPDAPVLLEPDEILNPFNTDAATQAIHVPAQQTALATSLSKQADLPVLADKLPAILNATTTMPNGRPLPLQDGYVSDYPQMNFNKGQLAVHIENVQGKSNLLVFLYHLRPLNTPESESLPQIAAAAYVSAGQNFSFEKISSGYYQLKWVLLSNNTAYKNKPFSVFRDNKIAYDRLFVFKHEDRENTAKSTKISLSEIR